MSEDWRKVFIVQYNLFGTIAGLEVTALSIFAALFHTPTGVCLLIRVLFTFASVLLFFQVVFMLWMLNQERRVTAGDPMQCFRENERTYRTILLLTMSATWGFILTLLILRVWGI